MWDNPRLLNAAAGLLTGLALLIFGYAGLQLLLRSSVFPLREIVVRGDLKYAARDELEHAVQDAGGNFFAIDLASIRGRLERVGWVRQVEVRRMWPDRLEVRIEEHVALANWGDDGLVNSFGEAYDARLPEKEAALLPMFVGPAGTSAELARRYSRFAEMLAPLNEKPRRIVLSARHAWQLRLAGGLQLELGRDGNELVEARLARFVAAWPETASKLPARAASEARYIDLRYPNGFAMRVAGWKG